MRLKGETMKVSSNYEKLYEREQCIARSAGVELTPELKEFLGVLAALQLVSGPVY